MIIDFVAGGLGAAASVIVGQPLDTVKVGREISAVLVAVKL